jgi:hypothetical protein
MVPSQSGPLLLAVTVGTGFTVTVVVAVLLQVPLVPVTV